MRAPTSTGTVTSRPSSWLCCCSSGWYYRCCSSTTPHLQTTKRSPQEQRISYRCLEENFERLQRGPCFPIILCIRQTAIFEIGLILSKNAAAVIIEKRIVMYSFGAIVQQ